MVRWNNFPRIEDVSHLDNVWFVLHVALFLSFIEEENWTKIDKEFIIKRILFNSFPSLILSDINSWTKEYIIKNNKDVFNELENKAMDFLLSIDCFEYIKNDIKDTFSDNDKELELSIIYAAKKYAWYKECLVNSKVFSDMYWIPLNTINSQLENLRKDLHSLDILLSNDNYIKYLSHIRRLSHSMRWNQQKRIFPISVMSHLVIITFLSYVIWKIENSNWANFDVLNLMLRGLYHDIPEAMTWDIITPTKKAIDWFEEVLEKVELDMMNDYFFHYISNNYKMEVSNFMLKPFEWNEWRVVKYADILCALFESKIEVNYWSENFKDIYRNIKTRVNLFDSLSVDYILKYWLDSFDTINDDIIL